jgi:predicted ATPase
MLTHPLPTPSTPFVGRAEELTEVAALLTDPNCRLLTLVGPGGIGKTRIALEIIQGQRNNLTTPIYFVPLAPVNSAEAIIPAITEAMQVKLFSASDLKQQLLDYLREKAPLLLILDNIEHLLSGADLVSDILAYAPDVKLLVTSRERLNLVEEWGLEVGGLAFPTSETETNIEQYSAVQLFMQGAQRLQVGFRLTEAQMPAAARICRLVEGMPLAIELASAWVRTLSCEDIANEIERSLDILETPARNMPARHRTMRAALEQSWKLLTDDERDVFMRLSVFWGGFRKDATQRVAGATLQTLSSLVDKSLLRLNAQGRYELHELLRQYGEEQLVNAGQAKNARDVHGVFYAEFLQQHEADLKGHRQIAGLDEIEADFDNIRAAWSWLLDSRKHEVINQAVESLYLFCEMRGRIYEGDNLFQHARASLAPDLGNEPSRAWGRVLVRHLPWRVDVTHRREML